MYFEVWLWVGGLERLVTIISGLSLLTTDSSFITIENSYIIYYSRPLTEKKHTQRLNWIGFLFAPPLIAYIL